MCERKIGERLAFFQKLFHMCFITVSHQGKRGKYGFDAKCNQSASWVFVNGWPRWFWSVLDLLCCCSNVFPVLSWTDFFFFHFTFLRLWSHSRSRVLNYKHPSRSQPLPVSIRWWINQVCACFFAKVLSDELYYFYQYMCLSLEENIVTIYFYLFTK